MRTLNFSVQDHASHRVMRGVTECDQRGSHAAMLRQVLRRSVENEKWFAAWFLANVDVAPTHRLADTGAERFGYGFFRGEARSQMSRRKFQRQRVLDLALRENAREKFFAEEIERMLDARAFDQIDANAEQAHVRGDLPFSEAASD